jgi:outer membrane protein assembly factor BamB
MTFKTALIAIASLMLTLSAHAATDPARWPTWRGVDGSRVVLEGNPPLSWSETKNIKWKTQLPGEGQSTPIIWDDKIFLQSAEALDSDSEEKIPIYKFSVLCLNRTTGAILWQTTVREVRPHQGHHKSSTMCGYSPVTDGERIWASFGSRGLFCLSMDGKILWEAKTIQMKKVGPFGEGSSPVLVDNAIIVLADHEGQSKLFAFNKDTGKIIWERNRVEQSSWNTPTAVKVGDHTEIITTAPGSVRSYNAATGDPVWNCGGLTSCAAPSPVVSDGLVYCTTGYKGEALMAIELGHTGDLTGTDAVRWFVDTNGAEVPTPLIHDGRIYVFKGFSPVLSCYDAATGKPFYERQRIKGMKNIYASPIAVGDNILLCDRAGKTFVLKAADEFEIVATNQLDEVLEATPVVIGDELYLRGRSRIYCIADASASE